jgi:hypothetical protein
VYGKKAWRLLIAFDNNDICPFLLERKARMWASDRKSYRNRIEQIIELGEEECQCILVEAYDSLYVTDDFLLTHNTVFAHGLGLSFLNRDHFYNFIDAEFTTPKDWVRKLLRKQADHPGFLAKRPTDYEQTRKAVRDFLDLMSKARADDELPDDTGAFMVVDSIRKLVPKNMMDKLEAGKGGIDGMKGRAGMIQAAYNTAWMNELVPLLFYSNATMAIITREAENTEATNEYDLDYKVTGGTAIVYDSSLAIRIQRAAWVSNGKKEKARRIYGERHRITIHKTKVGGKEGKVVQCYFHTSNGEFVREGFDRPRDVVDMAKQCGVLGKRGSWLDFGDHSWNGENEAVKALHDLPGVCMEIETLCRDKFKPMEIDPDTGEVL